MADPCHDARHPPPIGSSTTPQTAATPSSRATAESSSLQHNLDSIVYCIASTSYFHSSNSRVIHFVCVIVSARAAPMRSLSVVAAALLASVIEASTLQPPVLPLIVRNPYLSTWLQNAREDPWSKWPMFWTGADVCVPTTSILRLLQATCSQARYRLDSACLHRFLMRTKYFHSWVDLMILWIRTTNGTFNLVACAMFNADSMIVQLQYSLSGIQRRQI